MPQEEGIPRRGNMADSDTPRTYQSKKEKRTQLSGEQGHRCAYCGVTFGDGETLFTIDHVVPQSRGGRAIWTNLVGACFRCNNARGDEDAMGFFERKGWVGLPERFPVLLTTPTLEWSIRQPWPSLADVWPMAVR
jgi:uncharacterized protein (TIGR02646 family)